MPSPPPPAPAAPQSGMEHVLQKASGRRSLTAPKGRSASSVFRQYAQVSRLCPLRRPRKSGKTENAPAKRRFNRFPSIPPRRQFRPPRYEKTRQGKADTSACLRLQRRRSALSGCGKRLCRAFRPHGWASLCRRNGPGETRRRLPPPERLFSHGSSGRASSDGPFRKSCRPSGYIS